MKDYDFSGKAVLVTGGTGALGREICHAFLRAGALLATTYVADSGIPELESKVGDLKKNILFIKKDLGNEKDVQALVSEVVTKYGRIDVLANVVGGYMAGKPVIEIDEKDWDTMLNLNLKTAFLLSKHVVAQMVRQSGGKVIHTSARPGLRGAGNDAAYVASKSGVIRLVESIAEEVKSRGINVNCVVPTIPTFSVSGVIGIVTTYTAASSVEVKFLVCSLSTQTPMSGPPIRPLGNLNTRSLLPVEFPTRTKLTDLSFVFTEELTISFTDEYSTRYTVFPSPAS